MQKRKKSFLLVLPKTKTKHKIVQVSSLLTTKERSYLKTSHQHKRLGMGKCDNDQQRLRTESVYHEFTLNGYRIVFTNGIPDHCYQVQKDTL